MKQTIDDIEVSGKKVLLRVDFNVPLNDSGIITDANRINAELPTIKSLLRRGARVIICSHLGRPKQDADNSRYSMLPVAKYLVGTMLNKIYFCPTTVGEEAEKMANELKDGEVLVLENVRFSPEEEKNSIIFAEKLARLADIYVNDAFGTAHREHASTCAVAKLLPNATGYLMGREIDAISSVIERPERPFVAILGGAKVSDKLPLIKNFVNKCDIILISGGMAFTFLKAKGFEVGKSLCDDENIETVKEIMAKAQENNVKLVLPIDFVCGEDLSPYAKPVKVKGQNIPENLMGLDIGKRTIKLFKSYIKQAKSLIWNGPMGVFENEKFAKGTKEITKAVCKLKIKTVVGGGDSISAIHKFGKTDNIYHISTGGGASLKLMAGESLPGIEAISNK